MYLMVILIIGCMLTSAGLEDNVEKWRPLSKKSMSNFEEWSKENLQPTKFKIRFTPIVKKFKMSAQCQVDLREYRIKALIQKAKDNSSVYGVWATCRNCRSTLNIPIPKGSERWRYLRYFTCTNCRCRSGFKDYYK